LFLDGVYALVILLILLIVYGYLKRPHTKTSQLTTRNLEFRTAKLEFKKSGLLYQIKRFFKIN